MHSMKSLTMIMVFMAAIKFSGIFSLEDAHMFYGLLSLEDAHTFYGIISLVDAHVLTAAISLSGLLIIWYATKYICYAFKRTDKPSCS